MVGDKNLVITLLSTSRVVKGMYRTNHGAIGQKRSAKEILD